MGRTSLSASACRAATRPAATPTPSSTPRSRSALLLHLPGAAPSAGSPQGCGRLFPGCVAGVIPSAGVGRCSMSCVTPMLLSYIVDVQYNQEKPALAKHQQETGSLMVLGRMLFGTRSMSDWMLVGDLPWDLLVPPLLFQDLQVRHLSHPLYLAVVLVGRALVFFRMGYLGL